MIYDFRTETIKLHQPDKRFLAGAMAVLQHIAKVKPDDQAVLNSIKELRHVLAWYGVAGTEHLKRADKEELTPPSK